jgi:hypothetical protein
MVAGGAGYIAQQISTETEGYREDSEMSLVGAAMNCPITVLMVVIAVALGLLEENAFHLSPRGTTTQSRDTIP